MTTNKAPIRGAGFGGGKGGGGGNIATPTEAADSLQSIQYGVVLDLLSEGEIQGLDAGLKSIFLDGTPVQSTNGNDNFTGYSYDFRTGTQNQTHINGLGGIESEKGVSTEFTKLTPVTRTITDSDVDRLRVTIQIPMLQVIEDDGDITGNEVQIRIDVQYNGGGFSTVLTDTIKGKTSNSYLRDYEIDLTGAFPVDVRLIRVSDNETSARKASQTYWYSYTEIIQEKLRYPNSALAFLRFDSRQFNNIPSRKYLIRGIKVNLPSNATVDTTTYLGRVTYSGVWDGTFGAATWCADPAWCLYDLLTNTRYGAGLPASSLDKYDFYAISQYCNALVSDGYGGQEPRFQCHILLNNREEIYNVIQEMVSLFRGIGYYGAGSMVVLQDKPTDPQYVLGPSNVVGGDFSYSGSSQKSRHTTATVAYQSYDTLGEVEFEYVEDQDAIAKFGVINKEIRAMGCYSRGQAHRLGKWLLLAEQNLTETVSFVVSIESGIILRPGMVVDIADPVKSGSRRSGRISAATTTAITVDNTTGLPTTTANAPTISVMLPTGLTETRTVSSIAGNVFTVSSAFSEAPNPASVFLIETNDIAANQFRVISVTEGDQGTYSVTALQYNQSIYDAIESDLQLQFADISNLSAAPDPPTDITGTEYLYQSGQTVLSGFDVSWISPVQKVNSFRFKYRLGSDNWTQVDTSAPFYGIKDLRPGIIEIQIQSINSLGKLSPIAQASFVLLGKTEVPSDVQNLTIETINANSGRLRWDESPDLDVRVGGKVHIRHTSLTDGTGTWSNSVDLIPAIPGSSTEVIVPLVEGEILVKFADDGGRQSANETSVIVDFPDAVGALLVKSRREDMDTPPYQGTCSSTFYSEDLDALVLDGDILIDDVADFDLISSFDFLGVIQFFGNYIFAQTLDLGAVYSLDLSRYFVTSGFFPNDLVDSRVGEVDTWSDWDGGIIDKVNARMLMRRTDDDPTGTPVWTDWQDFVNGTFLGRAFQFCAELFSNDPAQNILIDELGYEATFQRRTEQSATATASGAGTKSITFANSFFTGTASLNGVNSSLPSIGIVAQNMASGDYFNVTNVTGTGFDVTFRNSAGTAVSRDFLWTAVGFGKGV